MKLEIGSKRIPNNEYIVIISLKYDQIFIYSDQHFTIDKKLISIFENGKEDLPIRKFLINTKLQRFFKI